MTLIYCNADCVHKKKMGMICVLKSITISDDGSCVNVKGKDEK